MTPLISNACTPEAIRCLGWPWLPHPAMSHHHRQGFPRRPQGPFSAEPTRKPLAFAIS